MPQQTRLVFLILAVALPLLEIALLIKTGQWLGFWPVLGIVLATAVAGVNIVRRQGLTVLRRVHEAAEAGRTPLRPVLEGAIVMLAGMLLVSPGLLCDAAAGIALVPWVRIRLAELIGRNMAVGTVHVRRGPEPRQTRPDPAGERFDEANGGADDGGTVIEGEFERLDERPLDGHARPPARRSDPERT